MRILILGGDGYLGWPTAMRFSARGHEVSVVDNFSRRRWHVELVVPFRSARVKAHVRLNLVRAAAIGLRDDAERIVAEHARPGHEVALDELVKIRGEGDLRPFALVLTR